jgi:hypothetical protein
LTQEKPATGAALPLHLPLLSVGRTPAMVTVVFTAPRRPRYAPVPLPATMVTGAVVEPAIEHVLGSSGGLRLSFEVSTSKVPWVRTSLLIVPLPATPW